MDTLREVLKEIQSGTTNFRPASNDEKDMLDFQPIAKILAYAHDAGLLDNCVPHKENVTGHHWYDSVLVLGGLSHKGEMFLAKPTGGDAEASLEEIIQLKPSVYGISVNLKALWKRWKSRKAP
jgi:hypothetical protein